MRSLFIDLNHWIGLAQARVGHPLGARYRDAYDLLAGQVRNGDLMIPLAATHYQEVSDIGSLRQRADIALTMDRLSRYSALANRAVLLRHEVVSAVAAWRGLAAPPRPEAFGSGFRFVFQHPDGDILHPPRLDSQAPAMLALSGTARAVIHKVETLNGTGWTYFDRDADWPALDLVAGVVREGGEYAMLRGPSPSEVPGLRLAGYSPETWQQAVRTITAREQELAVRLASGEVKPGKLKDIIVGRLFIWELSTHLFAAQRMFGFDREELFVDGERVLGQLLEDMPTMQVEYALRWANWRNGSYTWKDNDIHDLAQLGPAVAYCDIVLTEKHAAAKLRAAHVDQRYRTVVVSRVEELVEHLTW